MCGAQGWFHFGRRLDRGDQAHLGARPGQHAGIGPIDLRDSETVASRPVDRALAVGPNALWTAQGCHLRVIGAGLGWANVHECARLPAGSHILYHLARLDRKTLERLIEEEAIRPALKEREARELVAQFCGDTIKTRSIRAVLRERLRRLAEYFAANLADLNAVDMDLAEAQLTRDLQ